MKNTLMMFIILSPMVGVCSDNIAYKIETDCNLIPAWVHKVQEYGCGQERDHWLLNVEEDKILKAANKAREYTQNS